MRIDIPILVVLLVSALSLPVDALECKKNCRLTFHVTNCDDGPVEGAPVVLTFLCEREPEKKWTDSQGNAVFEETCLSDVDEKRVGQLIARKFDAVGSEQDEKDLKVRVQLCEP